MSHLSFNDSFMNSSTVPSKIVIAGNSKLTLNDRFATLPKPRAAVKKVQRTPNNRSSFQKNFKNQVYEEVEYVTAPAHRKKVFNHPRPARVNVQQLQVPIENRLSFMPHQPKVVYVPVASTFQPRSTQFNNSGFRNNFVNNQHRRNNVHQNPHQFNRNQTKQFVGVGFKPRRNFNAGPINKFKNFHNQNTQQKPLIKKKSVADLDKELDDYMRKPKHTPITI